MNAMGVYSEAVLALPGADPGPQDGAVRGCPVAEGQWPCLDSLLILAGKGRSALPFWKKNGSYSNALWTLLTKKPQTHRLDAAFSPPEGGKCTEGGVGRWMGEFSGMGRV